MTAASAHTSHSVMLAWRFIETPVPVSIGDPTGRRATSASSARRSADGHAGDRRGRRGVERLDRGAEPADAALVGARRAGTRRRRPARRASRTRWATRNASLPGARRHVEIGVAGALRAPGVDHRDASAAGPQVAEVSEGVGHHHPVPVRHDGVDTDGQQQLGVVEVGLELQLDASHQLWDEELRRAVDAQRAVALVAAEVAHEALGERVAGGVERPARAGVVGDHLRTVLVDERCDAGGDVVERFVPGARHEHPVATHERGGPDGRDDHGTCRRRDPWSTCIPGTTDRRGRR